MRDLECFGSIETRYASRATWAARLIKAVDELVADRLLLAEDGARLTAAAPESWGRLPRVVGG
jgi:hypothetical protein